MNPEQKTVLKELQKIPGVGKSIAMDLWNIGIRSIDELKNKKPEILYDLSNQYAGCVQDRCLLYVFRCAVYFAQESNPDAEKLKWWNWMDKHVVNNKTNVKFVKTAR